MSNSKLFATLGGLLFSIPLMVLLFVYVWFQTQYVQLGDWDDIDLVAKRWTVGQALNSCQLDITQIQNLVGYVHPRYVWQRSPDVWPRGEGANEIFMPEGTSYYAGEKLSSTARVFIKLKDGGPAIDIAVKNSLSIVIPKRACQLLK